MAVPLGMGLPQEQKAPGTRMAVLECADPVGLQWELLWEQGFLADGP